MMDALLLFSMILLPWGIYGGRQWVSYLPLVVTWIAVWRVWAVPEKVKKGREKTEKREGREAGGVYSRKCR
ncbi:hypothetical protein F5Y08DRAFT_237886 [Xylaria arbuscula]|nr:hypothetical protein F5Y08DRAFT_237886 [Xylaria arbuscula]